eukprot:scaffold16147_cov65-Phaeocystis_antarctica.AAC.1
MANDTRECCVRCFVCSGPRHPGPELKYFRARFLQGQGVRVKAVGLRVKTDATSHDISPRWFAGGAEASFPGEGPSRKKSVGKTNKLSGRVSYLI